MLGPVIGAHAPDAAPSLALVEALLFDAAAREQLGDHARAAEASLERALELAEPEGIVLPFVARARASSCSSACPGTGRRTPRC